MQSVLRACGCCRRACRCLPGRKCRRCPPARCRPRWGRAGQFLPWACRRPRPAGGVSARPGASHGSGAKRDGRNLPGRGQRAGAAAAGAGGAREREGRRTSRAHGQQPPGPAGGERLPLRVSEGPSAQSAAGRTQVRNGRVASERGCVCRKPRLGRAERHPRILLGGGLELRKKKEGEKEKEGSEVNFPGSAESKSCGSVSSRPHLVRAARRLYILISGGQPGTWSCRRGMETANRRKSLTCQILLAVRRTASLFFNSSLFVACCYFFFPCSPSCSVWCLVPVYQFFPLPCGLSLFTI
ncbi:uncharacterized protein LOC113485924 [Athene cunicularia]|uniref:uncharacterized protein LOC113485924 n=1 Tax=Athene cunicularia TaxID=194338 RepID=UPI000EF644A6|nr:uncharacterized protein LOC113485924 [Athene cunicularia]